MSPAGAEIPESRCEAPCFTIPVPEFLLKQQRYDEALRSACDVLSSQGITNYIHYEWHVENPHRITLVEIFNPHQLLKPLINNTTNSIELREHDLCDMP